MIILHSRKCIYTHLQKFRNYRQSQSQYKHLSGKLYLLVYIDPKQPEAFNRGKLRLRDLKDRLAQPAIAPPAGIFKSEPIERNFAKDDYLAAVQRAKDLIAAIKVIAPQMAQTVTDRAIQAHGGMGVSDDTPIAYFFTLNRYLRIADGPDEVHMSQLGKQKIREYNAMNGR